MLECWGRGCWCMCICTYAEGGAVGACVSVHMLGVVLLCMCIHTNPPTSLLIALIYWYSMSVTYSTTEHAFPSKTLHGEDQCKPHSIARGTPCDSWLLCLHENILTIIWTVTNTIYSTCIKYRVSFPGYKLGLGMRLLASVPQPNTLVLTACHHCMAISSNINAVNRTWKNISAFL